VRSVTTSLRGQPSSVPEARRWTVTTLSSWGLEVTAWTAAQVVSELATNCTLHARSDFVVRLGVEGDRVRVDVTDGAPGGLHARQYSATATTGRGLRIVESLSSSWGVVPAGDGKTVWVLLPIEDPLPASDDSDEEGQPVTWVGGVGAEASSSGPRVRAAAA
jgi:hypothetical protein